MREKASRSASSGPAADLRLAEALARRLEVEGSYSALAAAIERSLPSVPERDESGRPMHRAVDRRKLAALLRGRDVALTLAELRGLSCFLEPYGEGLAHVPLLRKPDLMQAIAEPGHVTFLLGSKPEERKPEYGRHRYFSSWDVLAMGEVQRGLNSSGVAVRLDIEDVPMVETVQAARHSRAKGGWRDLLDDASTSLVCPGSSRATPAAEEMLCKMVGREAFEKTPLDAKWELPFHFVWRKGFEVLPSPFRLDAEEIRNTHPDAAERIVREQASAITTRDRVFVDRLSSPYAGGSGSTYGVCVAQRRRNGAVWLVLAGITGPATFAAAKLACRMPTRLQEAGDDGHSDVYWAIVHARCEGNVDQPLQRASGVADESIVEGPNLWRSDAD